MFLAVYDDTSPAHVASAGDHNNVTGVEPDEIGDLALFNIKFDGVVDLDRGVWVADSPPVVGNNIWDALRAKGHFPNLEKFVGGFLLRDAVDGEATLNVIKKAEVFARLFDGDDV